MGPATRPLIGFHDGVSVSWARPSPGATPARRIIFGNWRPKRSGRVSVVRLAQGGRGVGLAVNKVEPLRRLVQKEK